MTYSLTVYPSRRLILGLMKGSVSQQDILAAVANLQAEKTFSPDFDFFVHVHANVVFTFTAKHFGNLISMNVANRTSKRAYLVYNDLHFGSLRMYEAYRRAEDENNFGVFRDIDASLLWINTERRGNDILTRDELMIPAEQA
jgi:hypothetical protein